MSAVRSLGLAIFGGLAMAGGFPDLGWWPLVFVALILLWFALAQARVWAGFFYGWAFGIAFLLPHVWWADAAVGAVPWVALSLAEGVAFGLFGAAWTAVLRSGLFAWGSVWSPPAFALLWVGVEQLRSMVPFGGFPWGRLAFSQVDQPVARLAWVGGAPLTAFVIALAAAAMALALQHLLERRFVWGAVLPFGAVALLLAGLAVPLDTQAQTGTLRLGIVQGNVPNAGLDAFAQARQVTQNHRDGTLALVESDPGPIDLVVWPENSADYDPRTDAESAAMVTESAQAAEAPVLLGTNDYSPEDGRYNSSVLWSQEGEVIDTYSKQRPAPFAEYIPIRDFARRFSDAVDRVTTDVIPGEGPATVELPVDTLSRIVTLGTVICFEVAYDPIVTESVAAGAEVLLVQTNNASFGMTAESTQQLQMTRLRAIETGRAAVQASTVGVSAVVTPNGRIVEDTELFTAAQMYDAVPLRDSISPAVQWRFAWHWGFLVAPAVLLVVAVGRTWKDRYEW